MNQIETTPPLDAYAAQDDVEALLVPNARALLPLRRQLLLYFDPFALFKDASRGSIWMRRAALAYNQAKRWMLLVYVRRWILIATVSLLGIEPLEALPIHSKVSVILAPGCGIGFCIAVVVAGCASVAYIRLGAQCTHD